MSLARKILIAVVVAGAASATLHFAPAIPVYAALFAATLLTALLVSLPARPAAAAPTAAAPTAAASTAADSTAAAPTAVKTPRPAPAGAPREEGQVKWFNVSKGFGFITKDSGEEIFVHFRSVRGEGRRGLREGQRVSFIEANTEKGPQAEDVEPL